MVYLPGVSNSGRSAGIVSAPGGPDRSGGRIDSNCAKYSGRGETLSAGPAMTATAGLAPHPTAERVLPVTRTPGSRLRGDERRRWVRNVLADSDLFGALSDDELDRLIARGHISAYGSGGFVFYEGDPGESLMVVLSGRIKISMVSPGGREVILSLIDPGHCCGEMALLDGKPRSADATAAEPSEVFVLERRDVIAIIERHPNVAFRIIGVLCARLRRATDLIADRMLPCTKPRIARALLRLAGDYGSRRAEGIRIDLKLSQGQLGALTGTTRERVNRQLRAWAHSGIIAIDEGYLTIRDPGLLCALAEEA
jgi:CRP/FNR family transcriptional regulator, cyclic AMP receptor protein